MEKALKSQQIIENKPIQPTLKKMDLYDKECFVIRKMKTVRATTSYLAVAFNMKFKTKQLNDEGLIEVTRIA
jgi:hypothetical protein